MWDYPRPPRVEATTQRIVIEFGGITIADTNDAVRVLETSHPPVYYLPLVAFMPGSLETASGSSSCEFKGTAAYLSVIGPGCIRAERSAWFYPEPAPGFALLRDRVAVYPKAMDRCLVDGEVVRVQDGDFYGGWITANLVGPFKGAPGTHGW